MTAPHLTEPQGRLLIYLAASMREIDERDAHVVAKIDLLCEMRRDVVRGGLSGLIVYSPISDGSPMGVDAKATAVRVDEIARALLALEAT